MLPSAPVSFKPPTHKRALSDTADFPTSKKPDVAPEPKAYSAPLHVFIVTTEQTGPYLETETHTIGAYATYQDAIWKAKALQIESDEENFDTTYEHERERIIFGAEDGEGDRYEISIEKMELRPPGSEEDPGPVGEEEEESEEEDDGSDQGTFKVEGDYPGNKTGESEGPRVVCRGCGCGELQCNSCWPQIEGNSRKS